VTLYLYFSFWTPTGALLLDPTGGLLFPRSPDSARLPLYITFKFAPSLVRCRLDYDQGCLKTPPAMQNASQKFSGEGTKIRKLAGTKFKFGQLILKTIIKIVATRCHILTLKCTKFDFGWDSPPHYARGVHRAP